MNGRYSITSTAGQLAERFQIDVPDAYQPCYNASPSKLLPVITADNSEGLSFFYWGLSPDLLNKKSPSEKSINVRSEVIPDKPVMLKKLSRKRCIIPADGLYEWKKIGKKTAVPYRLEVHDKSIFGIAGLWEEFENEEGERFHTFIMITSHSNDSYKSFNDRMPLLLESNIESQWLNNDTTESDLIGLLKINPVRLTGYTISPKINSINEDDPSLIIPAPAADQYGNLTLFD